MDNNSNSRKPSTNSMDLRFVLHDHEDHVHSRFRNVFPDEVTLDEARAYICDMWLFPPEKQELFFEDQRKIEGVGENRLKCLGVEDGGTLIVKHAYLPCWVLYKNCVAALEAPHCSDTFEIAKNAVEYHDHLKQSEFFMTYDEFYWFRVEKHFKIASWIDENVIAMRHATQHHFRTLHDQKRGDSEFTCIFQGRGGKFGAFSPSTMAFVRIHGEEKITKYHVKCHHLGPRDDRVGKTPNVVEFYCYKLLELIGAGPKCHFIPPSAENKTTNAYIATEWRDDFKRLDNSLDEYDPYDLEYDVTVNVCADVAVQLVLLHTLLSIVNLHAHNCGQWKGTKKAAIVSFAPWYKCRVLPNIKEKITTSWVHLEWQNELLAVRALHDEDSWLRLAKKYLEQWDLDGNIDVAREQLDPILVDRLERDYVKSRKRPRSPMEQLDVYIETLRENLRNLDIALSSI